MFEETTPPSETHPTLLTLEGLLTGPDPLMLIKLRLEREGSSTLGALVRSHAGTGFRKRFYLATLASVFSPQVTVRAFLCSVSSIMLDEV